MSRIPQQCGNNTSLIFKWAHPPTFINSELICMACKRLELQRPRISYTILKVSSRQIPTRRQLQRLESLVHLSVQTRYQRYQRFTLSLRRRSNGGANLIQVIEFRNSRGKFYLYLSFSLLEWLVVKPKIKYVISNKNELIHIPPLRQTSGLAENFNVDAELLLYCKQ